MSTRTPTPAFDAQHAAAYDESFAKLSPIKDALHLFLRIALRDLPHDARVLCVGAGTGAELLHLADAFPGWRFTALDTSAAMLDVCRQRAQAAGHAARCTLHHGAVASLDAATTFDAATSILVSQFVTDPHARRDFFAAIRTRLRPGAILVSADLSCDLDDPASAGIVELWRRALLYNGATEDQVSANLDAYRRAVAVVPPGDVEQLVADAGFERPTRFFQAGLIHAWYARRAE